MARAEALGHRSARTGAGGDRGRRRQGVVAQKKPIGPSAYDTSRFFVCW
jgi:hypothetical protein